MKGSAKPAVQVYPSIDALSRAVAERVAAVARAAAVDRGTFSLVLSGGSTPRSLYRLLGSTHRDQIPWDRTEIFWGDERYVPPEDPRSNYRMTHETLLVHVRISGQQIHPMPTASENPEEAATEYEAILRRRFPTERPRFDLVLLGLASDGHIASLFPGSPALDEQQRWVAAVRAPADPPRRLTLTLPAINGAAHIFFLVAGKAKAGALHRAVVGPCDLRTCPAVGVQPPAGSVIWWVDETAATFLGAAARTRASS